MRIGKSVLLGFWCEGKNEREREANPVSSISFNIVSKGLGSNRMSFYLNEAAGDLRDLLTPTLEAAKAKL